MFTQNSSYRTWATAAAVLFLLAGLLSLVSGPITAGAQEADEPSFSQFSESSAFNFVPNALAFSGGDAPAPASAAEPSYEEDGLPVIATDVELSECTSASPQLSVSYSVTDPDGLEYVMLSGTVGEEWIDEVADLAPGQTELSTTKVFDLTSIKSGTAWNQAWMFVDAEDSSGSFASEILDLQIFLDSCTVSDFSEWHGEDDDWESDGKDPEVVIDARVSDCDSAPKLTVSYTISDSDGFIDIHASASVGTSWIDRIVEHGPDDTTITFSEVFDLAEMKDDENIWNQALLALDVIDRSGSVTNSFKAVGIDFGSCTTFGDDESNAPTVVASLGVDNCDATPTLTVTGTASADNGLAQVALFGAVGEDYFDGDIPVESDQTSKQFVEKFDLPSLSEPGANNTVDVSVYAFDRAGRIADANFYGEIDVDACAFKEIETPDFSGPITGGYGLAPEASLKSMKVTDCTSTPILTLTYYVSDEDGINAMFLWAHNAIVLTEEALSIEKGTPSVEITETIEVGDSDEISVMVETFDEDGNYAFIINDFMVNREICDVQMTGAMNTPLTSDGSRPGEG